MPSLRRPLFLLQQTFGLLPLSALDRDTGTVPRRFDRVRLGRAHRFGEVRATRNSCCVRLVGPPGVRTCARARLVNQLRPPPGTLLCRDGATPRSGFAWFATAANDTRG